MSAAAVPRGADAVGSLIYQRVYTLNGGIKGRHVAKTYAQRQNEG